LQERGEEAATAREQAEALCAFLEEIGAAERLDRGAAALESTGMETTAAEYTQLWSSYAPRMEHCAQVLGEDADGTTSLPACCAGAFPSTT
jgi:ATP-dependent helicase/DNAse subunit B